MVVAGLLGGPGCSVIFDTEPYREEPGEGPVPTTPVVSTTPDDPSTLDELKAVIVTESTDPLGGSTARSATPGSPSPSRSSSR